MNCPDLCTKAKCEELEQRIEQLEQIVEDLKQINISGIVTNDNLQITVANAFNQDTETIDMSTFALDRDLQNHIDTLINDGSNIAHKYEPDLDLELSIYQDSFSNYNLKAIIYLEQENVEKEVTWASNNQPATISINGSVANKKLFLTVATNTDTDTATIDLPFVYQEDFDEHLDNPIDVAHNFQPGISLNYDINSTDLAISIEWFEVMSGISEIGRVNIPLSELINLEYIIIHANSIGNGEVQLLSAIQINGVEQNDTTSFFIPDMNCQNLEDLIRTENDQNQALLDALYYQIELRTGQIEAKTDEIYRELTQDISGVIDSDYSYIFEADADGNPKPIHPKITKIPTNYSGRGIVGIKNVLELLSKNQDRIFDATTKGISPIINLDLSNGIEEICAVDRIDPDAYSDENDFIDAATDILIDIFSDTASQFILRALKTKNIALRGAGGVAGFFISTTLDWGINYLLEKNFKKETTAFGRICEKIDNLDFDCGDVVAITASDKVIENVKGKHLVLHFVDFNNYPKRNPNSNYRPVQIPQAKNSYDWCRDFDSIRWITGNYYAKLHLKFINDDKWKTPITGYFSNKNSADNYFNQVLRLTNLVEDFRSYHPNTSRNNLIIKETRPYRAFIVSIDSNSQPVCETKYVPSEEEC